MSDELKPCPCGSMNISVFYQSPQGYWIECSKCGLRTGKISNRVLAVAEWNCVVNRAYPTEAKTAIEELQDALSDVTAERDRLREANEILESQERYREQDRLAVAEEADQLRAEVEALRPDAERYRFLCDPKNADEDYLAHAVNTLNAWADKSEIDQAIDAAMAEWIVSEIHYEILFN